MLKLRGRIPVTRTYWRLPRVVSDSQYSNYRLRLPQSYAPFSRVHAPEIASLDSSPMNTTTTSHVHSL